MPPRVSIVIATHDQGRWLARAIESVRAQTFVDWELAVVDDGSTDDTAAVVEPFLADDRIHYLPGARAERSLARNRGIAATRGELVAFLDADDLWLPEKLARQVACLDTHPHAGLCYTTARFVDTEERRLPDRKPPEPLPARALPRLIRGNVLVLASVMVRRTVLDRVGGFAPLPVYGCEDWDLWLRVARVADVVGVDDELTLYRRHGASTDPQQLLASALAVIDRFYADAAASREAGIGAKAVRARHYWYAAWATATTSRAAAFRLAARALRESPTQLPTGAALGALAAIVGARRGAVEGFTRA